MSPDRPPRILVVDDNRLVRELVRDTFREAGFEVALAADGAEALASAREARPDVVVTDVVMPNMDGWALCEALKADTGLREIPVVFLASQRDVPERLRGLRLGAHDYVCKPFSSEELLVRVRAILERETRARGASAGRSALAGHTSHMAVSDLVQFLAINGKTGALRLRGAEESGRIQLREGRIVGAATLRTHGRKALYRMLTWTDAAFEFDPVDDPEVNDDMGPSPQRQLMDALVATDDLARVRATLPADDAVLALAEGARELFAQAADLSPVDRDVLQAVAARSTLRQVLDAGDGTDLEIARAVARLIDRGAIEPVS